MLPGAYCADLFAQSLLLLQTPDIEIIDKAEDNADGQKNAEYTVPGRPDTAGAPADEDKDKVGQADFIGQGIEQGNGCSGQDGTGGR